MEGMDCWTGAFANAAGRASLEQELATFERQLEGAKERFDELNAANLIKQAEQRAQDLADSRTQAAQFVNKLADETKKIANFTNKIAGMADGADKEAEQAKLVKAQAKKKELEDSIAIGEERFARLNKQDAEITVDALMNETTTRAEQIAELKANANFEKSIGDQFKLESTDANKTEAERSFAAEQFEDSFKKWDAIQTEIEGL